MSQRHSRFDIICAIKLMGVLLNPLRERYKLVITTEKKLLNDT